MDPAQTTNPDIPFLRNIGIVLFVATMTVGAIGVAGTVNLNRSTLNDTDSPSNKAIYRSIADAGY